MIFIVTRICTEERHGRAAGEPTHAVACLALGRVQAETAVEAFGAARKGFPQVARHELAVEPEALPLVEPLRWPTMRSAGVLQ